MTIKTPNFLPGEEGYISKKEKTIKKKATEKKVRRTVRKKETTIGKLRTGAKGYRIGRSVTTPRKEKKYPIWRYSKKIGELIVKNKDTTNEEITLTFRRFGGIGSYKHLIQDADFQLQWAIREQELLMTQTNCNLCGRKISKTAKPNLYHCNLFLKRTEFLEMASKVPEEIVSGKLTIEEGWKKFNSILERGNKYYMSLKDTALICSACAKNKGLDN